MPVPFRRSLRLLLATGTAAAVVGGVAAVVELPDHDRPGGSQGLQDYHRAASGEGITLTDVRGNPVTIGGDRSHESSTNAQT